MSFYVIFLHLCIISIIVIRAVKFCFVMIIIIKLQFAADPCYKYKNLSEADRKISYLTPFNLELCDKLLTEGWYRFVGAAGSQIPTTHVLAYRCGTAWSGWLDGAHPTVGDGKVIKMVCFSGRNTGCKDSIIISVKNCGSFYIYNLEDLDI